MEIAIFTLGPVQTNAFLLQANGEAVLIDAPFGAEQVVGEALRKSGARLTHLLLTHGHWDHTGDAAALAGEGVEVWAHPGDRELYEQPGVMSDFSLPGYDLLPVRVDRWLRDGEVLELLGQRVEIRHVPGHAPGNVLFYFPEEETVVVGDALFAGSIGRCDLPGGDFSQLEKSIREKIYTLPEETIVLPGHGPTTKVGREAKTNPYVR